MPVNQGFFEIINHFCIKLFSPQILHKHFIHDKYDIEISFLEGPCARIISGCSNRDTKLVSWIHVEQHTLKSLSRSFRNQIEAIKCYGLFDQIICVSDYVKNDFTSILNYTRPCTVLYNVVDSQAIKKLGKESIDFEFPTDSVNLVAVGSLKKSKGYNRMLSIVNRLVKEGLNINLYILGRGAQKEELEQFVRENNLSKRVIFLGYDVNPYRYIAKADLFICASFSEGFSTAATEALIVGTPVCTVDVSGMKEMLGNNNEYGVVTANNEQALYDGIKSLVSDKKLLMHYRYQARLRGSFFEKDSTVKKVEKMLELL